MADWNFLSTEVRARILQYAIPQLETNLYDSKSRFDPRQYRIANPSLPYLSINRKTHAEVAGLFSQPAILTTIHLSKPCRSCKSYIHAPRAILSFFGRFELVIIQSDFDVIGRADVEGSLKHHTDVHISTVQAEFRSAHFPQAGWMNWHEGYSMCHWKITLLFYYQIEALAQS